MLPLNRRRFLRVATAIGAPALWLPRGYADAVIRPVRMPLNSSQAFLLQEDFEGTGLPSGWTDSSTGGTRDFDYTTTVLEGLQSFFYNDPGASGQVDVRAPFTSAADQIYLTMRLQVVSNLPGNGTIVFRLTDSSNNPLSLLKLFTTGPGAVQIQSQGGTASASASGHVSTSAWVKIKIKFTKGTGSDATSELWVVASGAGSWGTSVSSTNGTTTAQPAKANPYFLHSSQTVGIILDLIKVSTTDIAIADA